MTSSLTTALEEMTLHSQELKKENDVMKDENTQLKTNNDAMKDEIAQLKAENQQLLVSQWSGSHSLSLL